MTSIPERFLRGTIESVYSAPFVAGGSALFGFVYAKLADLPASEVAKAWAIWGLAQNTLMTFSDNLIEHNVAKRLFQVTITSASTYIGIQECRKRGLMGDKMMIVLIAFQALMILSFLSNPANKDDQQATATI
jgi:hypothetical protein